VPVLIAVGTKDPVAELGAGAGCAYSGAQRSISRIVTICSRLATRSKAGVIDFLNQRV
jgi:hypothetical protein